MSGAASPLALASGGGTRTSARTARRFPPASAQALLSGFVVPAFLLAIWAVGSVLNWLPPLVLPPPGAVLAALRDLAQSGDLSSALFVSLRRLLGGFALGAAAGLVMGAAMGLSRLAECMLRPSLMAFVQVPVLAWVPLLMIPLGIGEALKLIAIGAAAFAPVMMNASKGFRQVSPRLVEVGTLYRFTWVQRLRHILLPGALPAIFTGCRLGLTQAWQSLVVVELVASTDGIGYLTVQARQMFQLDQMLAAMVAIGVVGFVLDRALRAAETRLARRLGGATS